MKTPISLTLLVSLLAASTHAATLATTVSADTYIRNDTGGGATAQDGDPDNEFLVGVNGNQRLNGLVRFDTTQIVNDVNALGNGDFNNLIITSATLQVFERRGFAAATANNNNTLNVTLSGYGFNFTESAATYVDPDGDGNAATGDTMPGGTLGSVFGSTTFGSGDWDATADNDSRVINLTNLTALRTHLATAPTGGSLGNTNFILTSDLPDDSEFRSFTSDNSPTTTRHALLTINYTVVPEPAAALLGGLGVLSLVHRRRR